MSKQLHLDFQTFRSPLPNLTIVTMIFSSKNGIMKSTMLQFFPFCWFLNCFGCHTASLKFSIFPISNSSYSLLLNSLPVSSTFHQILHPETLSFQVSERPLDPQLLGIMRMRWCCVFSAVLSRIKNFLTFLKFPKISWFRSVHLLKKVNIIIIIFIYLTSNTNR